MSLKKIQELRLKKGLKQEQLANLVGISRKSLSHYETGRVIPPLPIAIKIAKALGTTVEELFDLSVAERR